MNQNSTPIIKMVHDPEFNDMITAKKDNPPKKCGPFKRKLSQLKERLFDKKPDKKLPVWKVTKYIIKVFKSSKNLAKEQQNLSFLIVDQNNDENIKIRGLAVEPALNISMQLQGYVDIDELPNVKSSTSKPLPPLCRKLGPAPIALKAGRSNGNGGLPPKREHRVLPFYDSTSMSPLDSSEERIALKKPPTKMLPDASSESSAEVDVSSEAASDYSGSDGQGLAGNSDTSIESNIPKRKTRLQGRRPTTKDEEELDGQDEEEKASVPTKKPVRKRARKRKPQEDEEKAFKPSGTASTEHGTSAASNASSRSNKKRGRRVKAKADQVIVFEDIGEAENINGPRKQKQNRKRQKVEDAVFKPENFSTTSEADAETSIHVKPIIDKKKRQNRRRKVKEDQAAYKPGKDEEFSYDILEDDQSRQKLAKKIPSRRKVATEEAAKSEDDVNVLEPDKHAVKENFVGDEDNESQSQSDNSKFDDPNTSDRAETNEDPEDSEKEKPENEHTVSENELDQNSENEHNEDEDETENASVDIEDAQNEKSNPDDFGKDEIMAVENKKSQEQDSNIEDNDGDENQIHVQDSNTSISTNSNSQMKRRKRDSNLHSKFIPKHHTNQSFNYPQFDSTKHNQNLLKTVFEQGGYRLKSVQMSIKPATPNMGTQVIDTSEMISSSRNGYYMRVLHPEVNKDDRRFMEAHPDHQFLVIGYLS